MWPTSDVGTAVAGVSLTPLEDSQCSWRKAVRKTYPCSGCKAGGNPCLNLTRESHQLGSVLELASRPDFCIM